MPNEVTPTQADRDVALIDAIIGSYNTARSSSSSAADHILSHRKVQDAFVAHRIALEAPLLAESDRRADCVGVLQRKRDELLARVAELEGFVRSTEQGCANALGMFKTRIGERSYPTWWAVNILQDTVGCIGETARAALKQEETK